MRPAHIPTLSGETFLGHVKELRHDRLTFIRRLGAECRDIMKIRLFNKQAYFVNSPRLLHEVLVEKSRSFEKTSVMRYMLYPVAGEGLFTSGGQLWRTQRKLMAPIFQQREIGHFAGCMVDGALRGMSDWRDGEVVDIAREMTRITMSVAGRALFEAETFDDADALGAALTVALEWANGNAANPVPILQTMLRRRLERWSPHLPKPLRQPTRGLADSLHGPILLPTPRARRLKAAVRVLDEHVQRMIDQRRAAGLGQRDLLTRLLLARDEDDGTRMSDRQVRDEVLTLFIAGHETTATALAWSFYLLAKHPEVLARVMAEIAALGPRPPRFEDVPRLGYTLQVFKEALRLYPPVYIFSRETSHNVEIGGHPIPRSTVVFMSPYAMHHRPDLWADPYRFDPSRFTMEAEGSRPRMAYFPFSAGPRICIGNHFALMEGQLLLATLLSRARFELAVDEVEPEPGVTLRPRGGIPMRVHLTGHAETRARIDSVA
jgi:cytochrome P450